MSPAPTPAASVAAARDPGPRARELGLALLLGLVALGLFARLLSAPWLEVSDAALRATLDGSVGRAWHAGGPGGVLLWLEGDGTSALVSRAVALLLHAANAVLVFALLRRWRVSSGASALGALFFAVHPLRVEAVAWLSQRGTLLGTFLFLLGLSCLARRVSSQGRRAAFLALPLLALSLFVARGPATAGETFALGERAARAPLALAETAQLWLWPRGLTPHHAAPALGGAALAASGLALALVLAAAFRARREFPGVALGLAGFVAVGLLVALVSPHAGLFAESEAYLTALGLELALVLALDRILRPRGARALAAALGLGACVALGVASARRLDDWRGERTLQERALAVDPDDARAHDALGLLWLSEGRLSQAALAHERALAAAPDDALALLHLGEIEIRRALLPGQEEHLLQARAFLERSLAQAAASALAHERMGETFQRGGDGFARATGATERAAEVAARWLQSATELDPWSPRAHVRLGMVRLELGDAAGARAAFERATELAPQLVDGWTGLALALQQANEVPAAGAALDRALALEPDHVEARYALATIQEARGEREQAAENYRRAVGVNPDYVPALFALGALLEATGNTDEALRCVERVVELRPRPPHVRAHLASARLCMQRGESQVARERLRAVLEFNPEQAEAQALLAELERSPAPK